MCFLTNMLLPRASSVPPLLLLLKKKFVPLPMVRQHLVRYLLQACPDVGARMKPSGYILVFRQVGAFPSIQKHYILWLLSLKQCLMVSRVVV